MFRGRSSARSGGATLANAPSCPLLDGDARSAHFWSSTTYSPMRCRARPLSPTSRFAVGATTNTRPSWSSARMARRSSVRHARPAARPRPDRAERSTPSRLLETPLPPFSAPYQAPAAREPCISPGFVWARALRHTGPPVAEPGVRADALAIPTTAWL